MVHECAVSETFGNVGGLYAKVQTAAAIAAEIAA